MGRDDGDDNDEDYDDDDDDNPSQCKSFDCDVHPRTKSPLDGRGT